MEIRSNLADRIMSAASFVIVTGTVLYLAIGWNSFPDKVPMHYNGAGEIDRWGGKGNMLLPVIIMIILYLGITLFGRFPEVWNTGVTVTPENRERVYRTLKYMVGSMRLIVVGMFSFLTVNTTLSKPLPGWFTPAALILVFGDMIVWLVILSRCRRKR